MTKRHLLAASLAGIFAAGPALAQEASVTAATPPAAPVQAEKFGRELGGHLFMPSHVIDDPFSYTAFGMYFGLGSGNALGPELQLSPPAIVGEKWYGYTGLGLGMILNVRILEYLSVRAVLNTSAYLGTGSGAALTVGTSAGVTGSVGVKGSLPVGENFRFAATIDASYGPVYSLLLAQGLVDALNNCRANPSQCSADLGGALQETDTVTWVGGLVGSWAPTPYLGFTANFQFIAPTKTGSASASQNGVTIAGMGEFDARPLLPWLPVGVNLAYQLTTPVGGSGVATAQEAGFGFYYTGRKDLALGLELDWKWSTLETQQVSKATLAWINFRYYWN
jgi:hypothetical protein